MTTEKQAQEGAVTGQGPRPYQPGPTAQHCPRCHYFKLSNRAVDTGLETGWCRRNSPSPRIGSTAEVGWPRVHSGDWCGDYVQADD